MNGFAARERRGLADLFATVGPDAPTLCEGWRTSDLVAHLVLRESRPDAAVGILAKPAAAWTRRVQDGLRDRTPYPQLVARFRAGPPVWSPTRLGGVDEAANSLEFFIHTEDVRRAAPEWQPRKLDQDHEDEIWKRLRSSAKLSFRKAPVGVTLVRTPTGQSVMAKPAAAQTVTVSGAAGELALFASGRLEVAQVELTGDESAVERLRNTPLGI